MLSDLQRLALLRNPDGPVDLVIDTDTANEIDDQFAVTWALQSDERLRVDALYAAPFVNKRAATPEEGMEKSLGELHRLLDLIGGARPETFAGSRGYLPGVDEAVESDAASDLIARAKKRAADGPPLYVATIGCVTNVASALLLAPEIADRLVVVLLAGSPHDWPTALEFNLEQDVPAVQAVLRSGVPIVHVPAMRVAQSLGISWVEVQSFVRGRGRIGDYLADLYQEQADLTPGYKRTLWDLAAIAWLIDPSWAPATRTPFPTLTDLGFWSPNHFGPIQRVVQYLEVSAIFMDFFRKLNERANASS